MSSGAYFPSPRLGRLSSKEEWRPKDRRRTDGGGPRARTVVKQLIEPTLAPIFLADSYGYRRGKSTLDAIGCTQQRCWNRLRHARLLLEKIRGENRTLFVACQLGDGGKLA